MRIALFAITALVVVWISAAQRRTAESLRRTRDDLRATVAELEKLNTSLQAENAERVRAEQSIRQAERELQVTIDTIPAIVARYRRDGSPDFVNETWRTYTGLSLDSLPPVRVHLLVRMATGEKVDLMLELEPGKNRHRVEL